ncbi:MAG TPA: VWA domain-containing protein [Actinospica sp.]|nr:VWA domain-containing protein [Actinospica sp.]
MRFPFSAVLGQDDLRLALILNAVHPAVGGVLVRGEKGTAKSTMVRALAAVLPAVPVVPGCRFSCEPGRPDPECPDGPHPDAETATDAVSAVSASAAAGAAVRPARLVELPIGASEDRLTGALDLERALGRGEAAFQPGLLAAAHRGLLYVDEVNLLPDHLVDVLLDAAAMGEAHVERDGVSVRHAARFLLVGTMNPEEGELRPQLLDRFGLTVDVAASREPRERAEVVRRRLAYEADPAAFVERWAPADAEVGRRIAAARAALAAVVLPDAELERIARVCAAFEVDGMRADLVTARAAVALAAWRGLSEVTATEVRDAARLALPHRRRRNPFDAPGLDQEQLENAAADPEDDGPGGGPDGGGPDGAGPDGGGPDGGESGNGPEVPRQEGERTGQSGENDGQVPPQPQHQTPEQTPQPQTRHQDRDQDEPQTQPQSQSRKPAQPAADQTAVAASDPYRTRLFSVPGVGEGVPGRRSAGRSAGRGRTVGAERPVPGAASGKVIHLPATLRAAAPHQGARRASAPDAQSPTPVRLRPADLRTAVRRDREGNLVLFAVDASGSMAARARMSAVKGAVLSLLLDAYQRRDKVGLVTFRGSGAEVELPPTGSVEAAAARLGALPTGGRTPLAAGLLTAYEVVRRARLRDPRRRPLLVLVTDGRATGGKQALAEARRAAAFLAAQRVASIVVDCESGPVRLGLAGELAALLEGEHVPMSALSADALDRAVRSRTTGDRVPGDSDHLARKAA